MDCREGKWNCKEERSRRFHVDSIVNIWELQALTKRRSKALDEVMPGRISRNFLS